MLTPTGLKVRGFRGFLSEQVFRFDEPVTILYGENHRGKSSALNALEWALFGADCAGAKTNIRERVGWEIPNCHAGASDVFVELKMASPEGEYVIRRSLAKPSAKRSPQMRLEIALPDSGAVSDDEAEERLAHLLGYSFRDFMTTAYQHQEAIRDIVTQEPRQRDDAIDRLLGLSDYRNLLSSINDANARGWQKEVGDRFSMFNDKVQVRLQSWDDQLKEKREEVAAAGVTASRITTKTAVTCAADVRRSLADFAEGVGIEIATPDAPQELKELARFEKSANKVIVRLRGEMPDAKEQEDLFERRTEVRRLKTDLGTAKEEQADLSKGIRALDKAHRGQQALTERIDSVGTKLQDEKDRLRAVDTRASLLREAIDYLKQMEGDKSNRLCPVCGRDSPDLLDKLRKQLEKKLQGLCAKIDERIEELTELLTTLEGVAKQYKEANKKQVGLKKDLEDGWREAGELLAKELTLQDDAIALLADEEKKIGRRLTKLKDAVQQKQDRLNEVAGELEKVRLIRELLQLEERKKLAEAIQESPAWKELEVIRDRAAEFVEDLKNIQAALNKASQEEARGRLAAADRAIDAYFRKLTGHPAVRRVKLTLEPNARSGQNTYIIADQDENDLTPVLSQGDLNALALAIFLGLATASGPGAPFGFVMLDDPSQSLGTEHKEKLVDVLDEVAACRQVIVATMDREFHDCLEGKLTKAKAKYVFGEWTPEGGAAAERRE